MASSAHKSEEEVKEHYDSEKELEEKVTKLVELIKASKHFIAFTGAGISTSAGIPDFRGPEGKWTREAKGLKPKEGVKTVKAFPTATHLALVKLQELNLLKYLISQNCDGLHLRSGFPANKISELHGNGNKEICETCGQCYFRDFKTEKFNSKCRDRFTGRFCTRPQCDGRLLKTTICFGQNLPDTPLKLGYENAEKADLCLAMGSSLTVSPACDMPDTVASAHNLVIVNLQKTPLSKKALHIFAKTDVVMKMVMEKLDEDLQELDCSIPEWRLRRKVLIGAQPMKDEQNIFFYARGCDYDDPSLSMTFIQGIDFKQERQEPSDDKIQPTEQKLNSKAPTNNPNYATHIRGHIYSEDEDNFRKVVPVEMKFVGHYKEPSITIECDFTSAFHSNPHRVEYLCEIIYNPFTFEWTYLQKLSDVEAKKIEIDPSFGKICESYVVNSWVKKRKMTKSKAKALFKETREKTIRQARDRERIDKDMQKAKLKAKKRREKQ